MQILNLKIKFDLGEWLAVVCCSWLISGCSLKSYDGRSSLRIALERPTDILSSFWKEVGAFQAPTTISQFSCFTVNITGSGVAADPRMIAQCQTSDNMKGRGFGIVPEPQTTATPLQVPVPAGPARTLDVYGLYPSTRNCGGTGGGSPGDGQTGGYYLGTSTIDLFADTAINIPISFTSGTGSSVSCNGGGSSTYRTFGSGSDGVVNFGGVSLVDVSTGVYNGRVISAMRRANFVSPSDGLTIGLKTAIAAADFQTGDEVLWVVMAADALASCGGGIQPGYRGFSKITGVTYTGGTTNGVSSAGYLTLETPIAPSPGTLNLSSIDGALPPSGVFCSLQIVRVPSYSSMSLTFSATAGLRAPAYSYSSGDGGVLAIKVAGTLDINSNYSQPFGVLGNGFPGGAAHENGAGWMANVNATSGSGGTTHVSGGGGGGAGAVGGGAGGDGSGPGGVGGVSPSWSPPSGGMPLLQMGGGGAGMYTSAGAGGGIVILNAKSITQSSVGGIVLEASGAAGSSSTVGAGGGGGGTVELIAQNTTASSFLVNVKGGDGGSTTTGGGGGGGIVLGGLCTGTSPTISVAGGTGPNNGSNGVNSFNINSSAVFCSE